METKTKAQHNTEQELQVPKMYKVLMYNDDVTPMDFVLGLLAIIFHHSDNHAYEIMMKIHTEGLGVCGVYTQEIAQTRTLQAKALAKSHAWPLNITMEVDQ